MSSPALEGLPLIQTKLHRPLVPVDLVSRPQLTGWLDERRHWARIDLEDDDVSHLEPDESKYHRVLARQ